MGNLTGPELGDSEEESVCEPYNQDAGYTGQMVQPGSTGYTGQVGHGNTVPTVHNGLNGYPDHTDYTGHTGQYGDRYSEKDENAILYGQESGHLQVLYDARGQEMSRLKQEIATLNHQMEIDNRQNMHQMTLLKAENGKLKSNLEHFQNQAQIQNEENRNLRAEIDRLKAENTKSFGENSHLKSQIESQNMMIQTLQTQIQELQRSDTILR